MYYMLYRTGIPPTKWLGTGSGRTWRLGGLRKRLKDVDGPRPRSRVELDGF